jgi:hypothetical protein
VCVDWRGVLTGERGGRECVCVTQLDWRGKRGRERACIGTTEHKWDQRKNAVAVRGLVVNRLRISKLIKGSSCSTRRSSGDKVCVCGRERVCVCVRS